ncbi:MAG TPA: MATE family efflux transporter [Cytophagales bacterium]|nr:MATE family efflux transporter [Cytophagales bacterium]HAA19689.1 MATE family efflux transporter [Cytophagales bacterium]HAP61650.1 MATE family efflux transporter [Cytophagales bacterium]
MTVKELQKKSGRILSLLKESLTTKERDYTRLGLKKAVFMLAIPTILEMSMESLFAFFDILFVGQIDQEDGAAVAAVGLTEQMMFVLYSIGFGIAIAATALISRRIGEKNKHAAGDAAVQAIWLMLVISVVIGVIGFLYAPEMLGLMNATESVIQEGAGYTRILFGFNISVMLIFLINGIFRGGGDATIAMRTLILANSLNIILDPLLIFGLPFLGWNGFGVEGAAMATTIGRSVGVIYQIRMLRAGKANLIITRANLKVHISTIRSILKISVGSIGQFLVESASWIFIGRLIADFGTLSAAGFTLALRVVITTILPFFGLATASATLVGQNLGAMQPQQAEKSAWFAANLSAACMATLSIAYFIFAPQIIYFLSPDPEVVILGAKYLRVICIGYLFFAYGMVLSQSLNGAGDTITPTWLNIVSFWMVQIPLGYLLAKYFNLGAIGAVWAITVAFSLHALLSMWIFKRGKWKLKEV